MVFTEQFPAFVGVFKLRGAIGIANLPQNNVAVRGRQNRNPRIRQPHHNIGDVVLAQIGNAYRASQLKDASKGRRLLGDHEPLDKSKELAVYSFVESVKGTKVKKIDFGHITGAMTGDHLDAARSLYNKTVRLVNSKNNE